MNRAAIYRITNLTNGKLYIGSSKNAPKRLSVHRWKLRRGQHDNVALQAAWDSDGESAFEFAIVETVDDLAVITVREQHWIDTFHTASHYHGYNACKVAGTREGSKQPPGFAETMRAIHKGKPKSAAHRAAISAARKGQRKTEDHKQKLREAAIKQFIDPAAREAAAIYGAMTGPLLKGRKHSAQSIKTFREAAKRRHRGSNGKFAAKSE